ncbi:hypothetical protein A5675_14280 [Mycobacterium malmoense]|uniref:Uncharacterized protein n=1 Tax=Mycobacterium malmoense TaxID=1780 RepID=A0A1B9D9R5_MYCMA|nr:hypothetical protein [Mycobacterium malmoense]OCB18493.1 hypothetical protein A5674_09545 [Mycobacterium malmoense]OCB39201.1 hypothetical protein A5675_14280 [Mycobacterium malmoense]OCB56411.1 hypothetical protein A5677_17990 [Mycobacterium malmoense]
MSVAPKSQVHVSIDDDIEFLSEQLEQLRALGEEKKAGDVFGDEDIYDLSVRWGTALAGRLPRIAHYSSIGLLDEADERRFQSLCDELRAVSPLIDRFKLAHPDLGDCPDARAGGRHRRDERATGWRRRLRRSRT